MRRLGPLQRALLNLLTEPTSMTDLRGGLVGQGYEVEHARIADAMRRLEQRKLVWRPHNVARYRLTHRGRRVV